MSRLWDYHGGLIGGNGRPVGGVHNLHSIYNHGVLSSNPDITKTWIGTTASISNLTSYTFSTVSIGSAPAAGYKRYVVVGVGGLSVSSPAASFNTVNVPYSITIDGNSMTSFAGCTEEVTAGQTGVQLFYYELNTGVTADFVITCDLDTSAMNGLGIGVWSVTMKNAFSVSGVGEYRDKDNYTLSMTVTSYNANDLIFACGLFQNDGTPADRYGGTLGITYDGGVDTNTSENLLLASKLATASGSSETITFIHGTSTSATIGAGVCAGVLRAA